MTSAVTGQRSNQLSYWARFSKDHTVIRNPPNCVGSPPYLGVYVIRNPPNYVGSPLTTLNGPSGTRTPDRPVMSRML